MSIIINKSGVDVNDVSYGFLQVELMPKLENDTVFIKNKCYNGLDASIYGLEGWLDASTYEDPDPSIGTIDVSIWISPINSIFPVDWDKYEVIQVPFELEASGNLINWSHDKVIEELTDVKSYPDSYMVYEADIFELDPSTGEPMIDPSTGLPIINHAEGDLVMKEEETYLFYTKVYDRFCELEDVSIKL